jgi:hypothetical protein
MGHEEGESQKHQGIIAVLVVVFAALAVGLVVAARSDDLSESECSSAQVHWYKQVLAGVDTGRECEGITPFNPARTIPGVHASCQVSCRDENFLKWVRFLYEQTASGTPQERASRVRRHVNRIYFGKDDASYSNEFAFLNDAQLVESLLMKK